MEFHRGSVLGPLLFLIIINDIANGMINWILKFADDTKVFAKLDTAMDSETLQKDIDTLRKWANRWQMEFNIAKCKTMHMGSRNRH